MPKVGLYARISDDAEGTSLGVKRQQADCRQVAKLHRWKVAAEYVDNDVSAFKTKVVRPEFERMLGDLEAGRIDGVVVYDLDRLARQPRDLERTIDLYDRKKLVFATVQGEVNLQSADGRTLARVMVAFANKSSMDTSRRVSRKNLELAQAGQPHGGPRAFGWKADKRTVDPAEAKLIRKAARDIIEGRPLHKIVLEWNELGITTPRGNRWQRGPVRNLLQNPRLAGKRVYKGAVIDAPGDWQPILDTDTWEALQAALIPRQRAGGNARKYLLAGVIRCGKCGGPMRGNARERWGHFYACRSPADGGCGGVTITGPMTDDLVADYAKGRLARLRVAPERSAKWGRQRELDELETRLSELMSAYGAGQLSASTVFPQAQRLEQEIAALKDERGQFHRQQFSLVQEPIKASTAWDELDVDRQREIVRVLVSAVVIKPAVKRGNQFDPERIEVVPLGE